MKPNNFSTRTSMRKPNATAGRLPGKPGFTNVGLKTASKDVEDLLT